MFQSPKIGSIFLTQSRRMRFYEKAHNSFDFRNATFLYVILIYKLYTKIMFRDNLDFLTHKSS